MKEQQFERGKIVYYIGGLLNEIYEAPYHPKEFTEKYRLAGLAFQTREEAETTLERVKKALKGEVFTKKEVETKLRKQRQFCFDSYLEHEDHEAEDAILNAPTPLTLKP